MQIKSTCDYVQGNLSAYYDHELDEKTYKEIQTHLRECITCRREFSNMAKMSYQLSQSFEITDMAILKIDIDKALECHYVIDNINDFIDKQLQKKDMSKISEHLLNCSYCRDEYDKIKNLKKLTRWYFSTFKMPKNIINYKEIVQEALFISNKRIKWASIACLVGAVFLMLLSAFVFSPENINPPEVATKNEALKEVIQDEHEIQVSNIKTLDVN